MSSTAKFRADLHYNTGFWLTKCFCIKKGAAVMPKADMKGDGGLGVREREIKLHRKRSISDSRSRLHFLQHKPRSAGDTVTSASSQHSSDFSQQPALQLAAPEERALGDKRQRRRRCRGRRMPRGAEDVTPAAPGRPRGTAKAD